MRSGIRKISSRVLECCSSLPPTVNLMLRESGSGSSSLVTITGPKGAKVSKLFPNAFWEPMENTVGFLRERSLSGIRMAKSNIGLA